MRTINLTVDNLFRHPLRWRKCPLDGGWPPIVFGLRASWGEDMPAHIEKRWHVSLYFWKWYIAWSNYRLD